MMKSKLGSLAVAAVLFGFGPAHGATLTWTNLSGGRWEVAANWSPNFVPGSADEAVITNAGNYTVQVVVTATVGRLQLGGGTGVQTLQIAAGFPTSSMLTVNNGFTNAGVVELVSAAGGWHPTLAVSGGTLVNTGTLAVRPGTGGLASLVAAVDNRGSLVIEDTAVLLNAGHLFSTEVGQVTVAANKTFTVNDGITRLGSASLAGSGVLDFSAGAEVDLMSDLVLSAQSVQLSLSGNVTVNGPGGLRNETALLLGFDTVNAPLENHGTITVRNGTVNSLVAAPGSTIRVEAGFPNSSMLTVNNGFTNAGVVELVSAAGGWHPTLALSGGTLVNTGTLAVRPGTGGLASLVAAVDNRGSLVIEDTAVLLNAGHLFSTEVGQVTVAANKTFTVNDGITRLGSASLAGSGVLDFSAGAEVDLMSDLVLSAQSVQLSLSGNVTVNGPGGLRNETTLLLGFDTVNAPLENHGTITVRNGTVNSLVTTPASTIRVEAGFPNSSTFTVNNGFTNAGNLELVGVGGWSPGLIVDKGPLVNTGTLAVRPDSGPSSSLIAMLDNRGGVTIDSDTLLQAGNATHRNRGTITLAAGSLRVNLASTSEFANDGTVDIGSGRTLQVLGSGAFGNSASGTLQGSGTLDVKGTSFSNGGTLQPGESLGKLTLDGALPQTFFGTVAIELGGVDAGQFDQIAVTGRAMLEGELNVQFIGGFVPKAGDHFPILSAAVRQGSFSCLHGLNLLSAGIRLDPVYSDTGVELVAVADPSPAPRLNLHRLQNQVHLCWPVEFAGYTPQFTSALPPAGWQDFSLSATNRDLFTPIGPEKYYRLIKGPAR